ncbi:Uu.00g114570.m01.CDS01 [Anthostomella pinea]|uniref:Uu.00g114570.m01.CDS01 n=1 Tax=Anthostomella pinea TaxID=933095 RepID=A0AAI8YE87_9PEZI|nr:Uu.00g114570.m01.CDS01 [Anthostomella pinea]
MAGTSSPGASCHVIDGPFLNNGEAVGANFENYGDSGSVVEAVLSGSVRKVVEKRTLAHCKVANLDFEARVPVPFSIFPRTYKDAEVATTTETHEELEINLPASHDKPGREGQYSSVDASAQLPPLPPRREHRYSEEEVRFTREEERHHRPGVHREEYSYEEHRPSAVYQESHQSHHHHHQHQHQRPQSSYSETSIEVDTKHKPHYSPIDRIEHEYRARVQPSYKEDIRITGTTVDAPAPQRPYYRDQVRVTEETVDAAPRFAPSSSYHKDVKITEETVEAPRHSSAYQKSRMGYYDEDGHYHSFRHGLHKMADRVFHHDGESHHSHQSAPRPASSAAIPNTVTIPCHHIRMGDILMLQGRPCQVIRISTSGATGQHRYLGVDLFTKQLHEESSFVSNPAPSVVVQTMLGPVFKQYRVLDMQEGTVVAMTETGDVKTAIPVIDQSGLYSRLSSAFQQGHGSVRVLVLHDGSQELVVDMKVVHGSRL